MANTRGMNQEHLSIWRGWDESVTRRIMLIYCCIIPEKNIYIYIYICVCVCVCVCVYFYGPGSLVGIATDYGLDGPGSNCSGGLDFPPVHTALGAHSTSCAMGTWFFPGVEAAEAWG